MNIRVTGTNLKVTEGINLYLEKKLARLGKFFDENTAVNVTMYVEKERQAVEIKIINGKEAYIATEKEKDLYASIDKSIDTIEGQIRKTKAKREKEMKSGTIRNNVDISFKVKMVERPELIKEEIYEIKPITVEDAMLKLEEKHKNMFLTFINLDTGKVNVIYRTKEGNYGLVVPEG